MFVNFSFVKNFHNKIINFKCHFPPQINHRSIHTKTSKHVAVISKNPLTPPFKYYKYLLLRKSRIKDFEILRRNLNTSSRLFNKNYGSKKNEPTNPEKRMKIVLLIMPLFGIISSFFAPPDERGNWVKISWEEFKNEILSKGEAKELIVFFEENVVHILVHEGAILKNQEANVNKKFVIDVPDIKSFEKKLREAEEALGIPVKDRLLVTYKKGEVNPQNFKKFVLYSTILFLMCSSAFVFKDSHPFITPMSAKNLYKIVDPLMGGGKGVKFSDVAGLKEAKTEIMDFVDYLKRPEIYRSLGAKVPKGALLLGPPGCGKTLLAKAVATEANVPFLSMNGSEFIEIIGGLGASRVRELFRDAKKRLPCIIYIDEIDAIGKKRVSLDYGGGEAEQTLNQLLVEMDGVVSNEGIVLLASTNRADVLDKALLRPGRFDRHILIDLPTFQERQEIFEHHLRSIHLEHKPEMYSKRLAHLTPGFSGADIANVCNEAALHAARLQKKIVQGDDLEYAVERVVGGTEKRSSSRTPEERKMFAYYEAGKALVGWLSKYGEALLKITIVARTDNPAGWTHFSPGEKYLYSVDDLRGKMCMGLGGRAAITLLFNRVTTAGQKDLDKVTKLAYAQVRRFGMSDIIGLMSFDINQSTFKKPYSKVLGNLFDQEARRLVTEAYRETEKLLLENKDKLIKLAEELLVKETLNYDDVMKLIGPPSFEGKKFIEPLEFAQSLDQAVGPEPEVKVDEKIHKTSF